MAYETQNNLAAGELSPLLYYRSDVAARNAGVKELTNMIALPHGPAVSRGGTEYFGQITDSYARMFTFEFVDVAFAIIIGTDNLYILDNDGSIIQTIPNGGVFSQLAIEEMQTAMQPRNSIDDTFHLHLVSRWANPHHLLFNGADFVLIVSVFIGADWTSPPGTITFHDGRMYLAGSNNEPVTVWGSKPNAFFDFDISDGSNATDGVIFPLAKAGIIRWIVSNDKLFVGLSTGEQVIFSVGGPIAPDNADTDQQSKFGSKRVQALVLENLVTYVNTDGSVVRGMSFSDTNEKYNSNELSFQAEHMTKPGIIELHYVENSPNVKSVSLLFCVLANGDTAIMSINTSQDTIGWGRVFSQDPVKSMTVVNENGADVQWLLFERDGVLYYEKNGSILFDSFITVDLGSPGSTVLGFDHLIGREVQVIADGKMHPVRIVQPDGSIELQFDATIISAGLGFNAKVITLPQANSREGGDTLNFVKRFSKMYVAIMNSARPIINGQDTFLRYTNTTMGVIEDLKTEILEVSELGWDHSAEITIEQPLPLPLMVAAIGGKLKENKL